MSKLCMLVIKMLNLKAKKFDIKVVKWKNVKQPSAGHASAAFYLLACMLTG